MASGIIGNDVPRKGLRVRVPCPPLPKPVVSLAFFVFPWDMPASQWWNGHLRSQPNSSFAMTAHLY